MTTRAEKKNSETTIESEIEAIEATMDDRVAPSVDLARSMSDTTTTFLAHINERWRMAKALVQSGIVPQKTPQACIAVQLKGHELGIGAMAAAQNIHIIDSRPALSADLMCALAVRDAKVSYKVEKESAEEAVVVFYRDGWPEYRSAFSIEDAERAGLLDKKNWKTYPQRMLLARAKAHGARVIAPDVLAGQYAVEEISYVTESSRSLDDLNAKLDERALASSDATIETDETVREGANDDTETEIEIDFDS